MKKQLLDLLGGTSESQLLAVTLIHTLGWETYLECVTEWIHGEMHEGMTAEIDHARDAIMKVRPVRKSTYLQITKTVRLRPFTGVEINGDTNYGTPAAPADYCGRSFYIAIEDKKDMAPSFFDGHTTRCFAHQVKVDDIPNSYRWVPDKDYGDKAAQLYNMQMCIWASFEEALGVGDYFVACQRTSRLEQKFKELEMTTFRDVHLKEDVARLLNDQLYEVMKAKGAQV